MWSYQWIVKYVHKTYLNICEIKNDKYNFLLYEICKPSWDFAVITIINLLFNGLLFNKNKKNL